MDESLGEKRIYEMRRNCKQMDDQPGEVVKVVHDDSHEEVQHEEAAEEDEGDKVSIGEVRTAGLLRVQHLDLNIFQSKIT